MVGAQLMTCAKRIGLATMLSLGFAALAVVVPPLKGYVCGAPSDRWDFLFILAEP